MAERKTCPVCGKSVCGKSVCGKSVCGKRASTQHAPFCSAHCANVDLGRWLTGAYRLPGEATEDSSDDPRQEQE